MEQTCEGCGSVWKINVEDEENKLESPVTAELQQCLMCTSEPVEEVEEFPEKVNEEISERLPRTYENKRTFFSDEANEIIKNNYKTHMDKELIDLIKEETGEDYSYGQVKGRRKQMGLYKERGSKRPRKYLDEHLDWLRENIDDYESNTDLSSAFNEKLDMNTSTNIIQNVMSRSGIKRKKRINGRKSKMLSENIEPEEPVETKIPGDIKNEEREKRKRKGMSKEAVEIIEENYMEKTDDELREMIADETVSFFTGTKIGDYRLSNGLMRPEGWNPDEFGSGEEP